MKKKLLVAAMMAAGIGAAGTASAVHVNPDGLGQVLLYPYYTTESGWNTYIKVVNTTNQVKAVKVRFLEGMNSREVLDFNLYLSPFDEWAGSVVDTGTGAGLATGDTSCTAPKINGVVAFRNHEYATDVTKGLDRTREGYVEIIEMGEVIDPTLAADATHVSGVPLNCPAIVAAANTSGVFNTSPRTTLRAPTGGLYGIENLVNRDAGTATSVDAVALENFWISSGLAAVPHHTPPGSLSPSLEDVQTAANVFNPNVVPPAFVAFNATTPNQIDNVSAVLTHNTIANDYGIGADLAASTDWVVTFPTKRFYVNQTPARAPFQQTWNPTSGSPIAGVSCDPISIIYYDREEATQQAGDDDFSPTPPIPGIALCHEVNTVTIATKGDTDPGLFGASFTQAKVELAAGFNYGWLKIGFPGATPGNPAAVSDGTTTVNGLPVIGFAFTQFVNSAIDVGGTSVLSNYGGTTVHKGTRLITP